MTLTRVTFNSKLVMIHFAKQVFESLGLRGKGHDPPSKCPKSHGRSAPSGDAFDRWSMGRFGATASRSEIFHGGVQRVVAPFFFVVFEWLEASLKKGGDV